jgi:hypothetical protein
MKRTGGPRQAASVICAGPGPHRLRWQIELAFKRMKSLLHIDRLPAKDPALARPWLHAHLLLALLAEATIDEIEALPP